VAYYPFRRQEEGAAELHLSMIPYKKVPGEKVKPPSRDMRKRYDDQAPLKGRHSIPEVY
jgi:hypothetical protein